MKRFFRHSWGSVVDNWRLGLLILAGIGVASGLLLFQLGSLVGGLSESEFALQQQIAHNQITPESILRNPVFLPYYLALYLMQLTPFSGPTAIRSISALFGILGAAGFFYILRSWYTTRIAFFGTALFATSAWFLHTARFASQDSSYLLLPLLIAGVIALQAKARAKRALVAVLVFGISALYIPGLIWFIVPALILQRRVILKSFSVTKNWFLTLIAVVGSVMLIPLVAMLAWPAEGTTAASNALAVFGLPSQFPSPLTVGENLINTFRQMFFYSNAGPEMIPGHLPWFDICTGVLIVLGIYQFGKHYKLDRSKLIAIVGIFGLLLVSLGGPVSIVLLLPFMFLFAVEGLRWLLDRWLSVFPRNPFARSFGVSLIALLVITVGVYQLNKYFLAWGHAPETRAVFNKLP